MNSYITEFHCDKAKVAKQFPTRLQARLALQRWKQNHPNAIGKDTEDSPLSPKHRKFSIDKTNSFKELIIIQF